MATQTLEFNAGTGLTISCKLFALGSDTVVATASATEKTNDLNRYSVAFTDLAAGAYRLNGFVGAVGGFVNEIFDVEASTATYFPRSALGNVPSAAATADAVWDELLSGHAVLGSAGEIVEAIKAKTDLLGTGAATVTAPVTSTGELADIVIGDDYLATHSRAFEWTVDAVSGVDVGDASCKFGVKHPKRGGFIVDGTVTLSGVKWLLSFDVAKTDTADLTEDDYEWSVEVRDASGNEITRVRNADCRLVKLVEKKT